MNAKIEQLRFDFKREPFEALVTKCSCDQIVPIASIKRCVECKKSCCAQCSTLKPRSPGWRSFRRAQKGNRYLHTRKCYGKHVLKVLKDVNCCPGNSTIDICSICGDIACDICAYHYGYYTEHAKCQGTK